MALPDPPYDPSLIDAYTDYRLFVIEALRRMGRSRADLAAQLDLSVSMLSQVLNRKKRLNPNRVPLLARYLGLGDTAAGLLAAMVDLDNDSPRAKRLAWATLQAHQRALAPATLTEDMLEMMGRWYISAVYELALCEGFRSDPAWIARTLVPSISVEQAEHALHTLLRMGMLEPDPDSGGLGQAHGRVWSEQMPAGQLHSEAGRQLQGQLIELAVHSYHRVPPTERHSASIIGALSEEQHQRLVARLREVEQELLHLISAPDEHTPTRVVELTSWVYPCSDYTDSGA